MKNELSNSSFHQQIIDLLQKARKRVLHTINKTMVEIYYEIGKRIVVNEQDGKERADDLFKIAESVCGINEK